MAKLIFVACMVMICMAGMVESLEFRVGGPEGWVVPNPDETKSYNQWASKNRFQIGDFLYFKYRNDSVLVVDKEAYHKCNATKPIFKYEDGDTTFKFNRYGFFYFISGNSNHCMDGQRLIVQVMGQSETISPSTAPSPATGGPSGSGDQPSGPGPSASPSSSFQLAAGVASLVVPLVDCLRLAWLSENYYNLVLN